VDLNGIAAEVLTHAGVGFESLSVLELNRSSGSNPSLVLLVFVDRRPEPAALIKLTREPGASARLEAEHRNLTLLAESSAAAAGHVPRPLFLGECRGFSVLAESALPGVRLKNLAPERYFRSRRFPVHLTGIVDFLSALRTGTSLPAIERAAPSIESFRNHFDRSPAVDALLDGTLEDLAGADLPAVHGHGDFCTANLLVDDDRIGVIDWEYPLDAGRPGSDLFYCLSSFWCIPYRSGVEGRVANYREIFFGDHRHGKTIRAEIRRYFESLEIPVELTRPLAVSSWVDYANRKRRLIAAAGDRGGATAEIEPLTLLVDNRCLNLEIIAEERGGLT
jgi:aminoglycoside phosphotransferase